MQNYKFNYLKKNKKRFLKQNQGCKIGFFKLT